MRLALVLSDLKADGTEKLVKIPLIKLNKVVAMGDVVEA